MDLTAIDTQILTLEASLDSLRKQRAAAAKASRESVSPIMTFSIAPNDSHGRIRPCSGVVSYLLTGTVRNVEECKAAGHHSSDLLTGSMAYLFNTATGRIVGNFGGGNIYIKDAAWSYNAAQRADCIEDSDTVFSQLESFLTLNPNGGDVTAILSLQRHKTWK